MVSLENGVAFTEADTGNQISAEKGISGQSESYSEVKCSLKYLHFARVITSICLHLFLVAMLCSICFV